MKVTIDISPLKNQHQFRGVGKYTKNLVTSLQSIKADDFSVELIERGAIPQDCDIVHYPYFDLFYLTLPLLKSKPTIVTVHDVIPLVFPKYFPPGIRGRFKFQVQKLSLKGAAAVITDSQNSKKDIGRYLGFPAQKIFIVPLAAGKGFKPITNYQLLITTRKKYNLPERFILYVGDVNYHKNIPGLIRAFHKLKTQNSKFKNTTESLKLVLIGKAFLDKNLKETKEILQLIKFLGLRDNIICPGWILEEELPAIYNLASAYCQPSFCEGFGLPVLEAMACGTPVVSANTASLRDIAVGVAIMVDPYDINSIADGIKKALKSRQELVIRSFTRSRQFSWEKTAQATLDIYKKVHRECPK